METKSKMDLGYPGIKVSAMCCHVAVPAARRVANAILGICDPLLALLRDILHLVDTPQIGGGIWRDKGVHRSSSD